MLPIHTFYRQAPLVAISVGLLVLGGCDQRGTTEQTQPSIFTNDPATLDQRIAASHQAADTAAQAAAQFEDASASAANAVAVAAEESQRQEAAQAVANADRTRTTADSQSVRKNAPR